MVWGPVVWIPSIPLWKGLLLRDTQNTGPSHQLTISWRPVPSGLKSVETSRVGHLFWSHLDHTLTTATWRQWWVVFTWTPWVFLGPVQADKLQENWWIIAICNSSWVLAMVLPRHVHSPHGFLDVFCSSRSCSDLKRGHLIWSYCDGVPEKPPSNKKVCCIGLLGAWAPCIFIVWQVKYVKNDRVRKEQHY